MRSTATGLILSATDLANHLGCRHRTGLEMAAARGTRERPFREDPLLEVLAKRGEAHETAFVSSLEAAGRQVVDLSPQRDPVAAVAETLAAMLNGADVIYQGALREDLWYGRPDILRRIECADAPSAFGAWSYEVVDTKLAVETRAGTILQLGLYSEMLEAAQKKAPEHFYVVTPANGGTEIKYRVNDYAAYFRLVRRQMRATVAEDDAVVTAANYPEPVDQCDVCPWWKECDHRRRQDDHLSLVAGITRLQRRELNGQHVATLAELAGMPIPVPFKPKRGSVEGYVRVREQARVQLESPEKGVPVFELLPIAEPAVPNADRRTPIAATRGLSRLPEPSPGDIFLDLEGDPMVEGGGREYLFGLVTLGTDGAPEYRGFWAMTPEEERNAFEAVMDVIMAAWRRQPEMHVFHYAPYEPSAFKRLMGRYAARGEDLDEMLRGGRFVDLYAVVRESMRAGVESYSIKKLEPVYGFTRAVELRKAGHALRAIEHALQLTALESIPQEVRDAVEGYNRDDCLSTLRLRDWLEEVRAKLIAEGTDVPRPAPREAAPTEAVSERDQRVLALRERLLAGVPAATEERSAEQQARWVLAYLLDWHRREDKATWWEYFRLCELPEDELLDERQAIAGMEYVERVDVVTNKKTGKPTGTVIDRYRYPQQEMEIGEGEDLKLQSQESFGKVVEVDRKARTIDVRKGKANADLHPSAVFAHTYVSTEVLEDAIFAIGESVAEQGALTSSPNDRDRVARDLLLRSAPRLKPTPASSSRGGEQHTAPSSSQGSEHAPAPLSSRGSERQRPTEGSGALAPTFVVSSDVDPVAFATRIVAELDHTVLCIQGPPGAGKTYCGARMIQALVTAGKRVGITATSHKVIRNLLAAVHAADPSIPLGHKDSAEPDDGVPTMQFGDNAPALDALRNGEIKVLGGTQWLWARPDAAGAVDVLFADEAGQMSLANVVAVSRAAESLVLLGDPQQLEQPTKGSHPPGVDASALGHMLGKGRLTISSDRGIFLPTTWRLAPSICQFTSELFYEGKLQSKAELEQQVLLGTDGFDGSGLWLETVEHDDNRNWSEEEICAVEAIIGRLTVPGARWWSAVAGRELPLTTGDVLVVAPYNAHVNRLAERLEPLGVRVGTVDKFQGQEAAVAIYSMATSRPEDAPRGMEFLYSVNRLNVATSRARCAAIVVASPRLLEVKCRTVRQMKLANALCAFSDAVESARVFAYYPERVGRKADRLRASH